MNACFACSCSLNRSKQEKKSNNTGKKKRDERYSDSYNEKKIEKKIQGHQNRDRTITLANTMTSYGDENWQQLKITKHEINWYSRNID